MKTFLLLFVLSGLWESKPEPTGQSLLITSRGQVYFYDVDSDPDTIHPLWRQDGFFKTCLVRTNPDRLVCYVNNGIYEASRDGQVKPLVLKTDRPAANYYFASSPDGRNLLFTFCPEDERRRWEEELLNGGEGTTKLFGNRFKIAVLDQSGSVSVLEDTMVGQRYRPYWLNNEEILYQSLDSIIKTVNVVTGKTTALFDGRFPLPLGRSDYFLFDNGVVYTTFTPPNPPSGDPKELQEVGWGTEHYMDSKGLYIGSVKNKSILRRISVFPRSLIPNSLRRRMENDPKSLCSCRESGRIVFWMPSKGDYVFAADTTLYVSAPIEKVGEIRFVVKKHFPFAFAQVSEVPAGCKEWLKNLELDLPAEAKDWKPKGTLMGD